MSHGSVTSFVFSLQMHSCIGTKFNTTIALFNMGQGAYPLPTDIKISRLFKKGKL